MSKTSSRRALSRSTDDLYHANGWGDGWIGGWMDEGGIKRVLTFFSDLDISNTVPR